MRPLGALVRRGTEQPLRSASATTGRTAGLAGAAFGPLFLLYVGEGRARGKREKAAVGDRRG